MECPVCRTEMRIARAYYTTADGQFKKVLVYSCRNKTCSEYGKEIKEDHPITLQED